MCLKTKKKTHLRIAFSFFLFFCPAETKEKISKPQESRNFEFEVDVDGHNSNQYQYLAFMSGESVYSTLVDRDRKQTPWAWNEKEIVVTQSDRY